MRKLAETSPPREVTVRISGIAAIPAVLEQLNADPDTVFARARVDRALFDNPANVIGITSVGRLVRESSTPLNASISGFWSGSKAACSRSD